MQTDPRKFIKMTSHILAIHKYAMVGWKGEKVAPNVCTSHLKIHHNVLLANLYLEKKSAILMKKIACESVSHLIDCFARKCARTGKSLPRIRTINAWSLDFELGIYNISYGGQIWQFSFMT